MDVSDSARITAYTVGPNHYSFYLDSGEHLMISKHQVFGESILEDSKPYELILSRKAYSAYCIHL